MKPYAVIWSVPAVAALGRLEGPVRRRIRAKVLEAATDPERYSIRLVNSPFHRIRVGDWSVIIHIDRDAIQVIVVEVKHRRVAYR